MKTILIILALALSLTVSVNASTVTSKATATNIHMAGLKTINSKPEKKKHPQKAHSKKSNKTATASKPIKAKK